MMREFPARKNLRLSEVNYRGQNAYFITFCSFRRIPYFQDEQRFHGFVGLLQEESARLYFRTHAYCLMPDHLHFLSEGICPTSNLLRFVKCLKLKSSREHAARCGQVLWQKGFYEHILRPADPLESVAWYMWMNPVRRGLVARPESYTYSGSFTGMRMPMEWRIPEWRPPWKPSLQREAISGA